jgi:cytochrome c553
MTMLKGLATALIGASAMVAAATMPAAAQEIEQQVVVCSGCHGANGSPLDPKTMPIIWGQQASYLFKQLHDYRAGDRNHGVMAAMAKSIKQEDMRKVANYFAGKQWPAKQGGEPPGQEPAGMGLCKICHQPNFEGGLPAPRLAGLSYDYLLAQMNKFADDQRSNNLDMPTIMRNVGASDREAMARYLSRL